MKYVLLAIAAALPVTACQPAEEQAKGDTFDAIAVDETVQFTGTEPFWGGEIEGGVARYTTPEDPDGTSFPVERFAGLNGVGFSGKMEGQTFDLTITPGNCSDGMSDRSYPFTATLMVGGELREGCAWTERQQYTGPDTQ